MGIAGTLSIYPLQTFRMADFWKSKSSFSGDATFFVIGIGVIIVILIIVILAKNKLKVPALNGAPSGRVHLHRVASTMGLNREQTKMLEFVFKSDGVTDPVSSLNSPHLLDRHFKKAYRLIEETAITDEEVQQKLSILFATRNIIESGPGGLPTTSTRQIPENVAAVLTLGDKNYPVRVISTKGDTLVVENPSSESGPLHPPQGSKVTLAFYTKSSKGFSVESRILGSTETKGGPVLQLVHSGQIKRLSNRRFRRRQTVIATGFYFVHIEDTGRRKEQKLVVDHQRHSGDIIDISIGGCSLQTREPVTSGQRLKVEFTREDNSVVAALGQVLRINRTGVNTIMHIKFLKVPRKSLNSINAMVYEYADKEPEKG